MQLPGPRIAAAIVDSLILLIPLVVGEGIGGQLFGYYDFPAGLQESLMVYLFDFVTITLVTFLYFGAFESSTSGATPGKRLMNIRVVAVAPAAWWRNVYRSGTTELAFLIWFFGPLLIDNGIDYELVFMVPIVALWLWFTVCLFQGDGRTPYDRWSGTSVVRIEDS